MPGEKYVHDSVSYWMQKMAGEVLVNINAMNAGTQGSEGYEQAREKASESFARMIKYYDYSAMPGVSLVDELSGSSKRELDRSADQIKDSYQVQKLFSPEDIRNTQRILTDERTGVARHPSEIVFDMSGELNLKAEKERQERHNMGLLAGFLEKTASKSFVGRLKSWFVGNSREYNRAIKALRGYADGTVKDKSRVIDSIKTYLDLRKAKVRDHQYGRDRFQGFMESLHTLMEPKEFNRYCQEVNAARRALDAKYDPRRIQPEHFAPEREGGILNRLIAGEAEAARQAEAREAAARERQTRSAEQSARKREAWEKELDAELSRPRQMSLT